MQALVPKWSALAKVQQVRTVRSMYVWLFVVPLLAKALAKVEGAATFTIFGHALEVHLSLPFSWQVFYFSALAFAAANLVFISRCYSLIKDHTSFADFRDQGKTRVQLEQYASEVGTSLEKVSPNHEFWDPMSRDAVELGTHLRNPFWTLYDITNVARPGWRSLCSLLYSLGFLLSAIVLLQNIVAVLRMIL